MISNLWKKVTSSLRGNDRPEDEPVTAATTKPDPPAVPASAPAGSLATEPDVPAVADPATLGSSPKSKQVAAPVAAISPQGGADAPEQVEIGAHDDGPALDTHESLARSMKWRTRILLDGAAGNDPKGDARGIVEALLLGADTVIRQPPVAAQKALRATRDPNANIQDMVSLFETDPTLTQALLRTANSTWYRRGGGTIVSIGQGVQRIGMKGVENVLLTTMAQGLVSRPGGEYNKMVSLIWSHMLRTAALSRVLAPSFRVDPEVAYAITLLHDVGKLVVFDQLSAVRRKLRRELSVTPKLFSAILEHLHEPLGGQAALEWGMGEEAAYYIAHHHRRPTPATPVPMTELIFVAEKVDISRARGEAVDWEVLWLEGDLTADRTTVEERIAAVVEDDIDSDDEEMAA